MIPGLKWLTGSLMSTTHGVLSLVPLAVVVSLGWWLFVVMTPPVVWIEDVLYTSTLLIHIALWVILGVVVWADPQEGTDSVPTG